jgi:hypothetical protein
MWFAKRRRGNKERRHKHFMKEMQRKLCRIFAIRLMFQLAVLTVLFSAVFAFFPAKSVSALTTVPTKMNFQGRLVTASGSVVTDGTYNMKFRIYNAASGGAQQWSETRDVSASSGVTVANGLFSVSLGDVTSLPASLFASGALYFEVELPTPATATCSTSSCAVWTEGAMTPRSPINSSAYAFNSDTLDGLDSTAFATVGGTNTFTGAASFNTTSNTTGFVVSSGGTAMLTVDTLSNQVVLGSGANNVTFTTWGGIVANGTAQHQKIVQLIPEYAGAVLDAASDTSCVSANAGTMTSGYDNSSQYNYYNWSSTSATAQCYDVVIHLRLPSDYASMVPTGAIKILTYSSDPTNATAALDLRDATGASVLSYVSATPGAANTWGLTTQNITTGTFGSDDSMLIRVRMSSKSAANIRIGDISLTYNSKF